MNITFNSETKTKKFIWGIILILAVAAIMFSQVGLFSFPQLTVGGIIWTVLAVLLFVQGVASGSFIEICMPLAILAIVWKQYIGLANVNNWLLVLCAFILSIGLHFIFPGFRKKKDFNVNINGKDYNNKNWNECKNNCNDSSDTNFTDATFEELNDKDNTEVNFGSQTKYYKSQTFESACLEANFASIKAFFTDAKMLNDSAEVKVECNFGSAELFVPKEWKTEIRNEGSFSGINHRGNVEWDGVHILYITTEVNFGGLTIHHV